MASNSYRTSNKASKTKPLGARFAEYTLKRPISFRAYQFSVLVLTFFAYASYHATRKTTSIVKSVLDPQTSNSGFLHWPRSYFLQTPTYRNSNLLTGWAPFDSKNGTTMLGLIDVAFLAVYSLGMYFAGHLGDRVDLRVMLTIGMVGSGFFTALFGLGYWLNIHSFYYFLFIQMMAGMFQSTGWPSVVAVVGNWFGKRKRGLIMGIWNAHTSVGNISGSLIAAGLLKYGWGWSFVAPGALIAFVGLMVFLFLAVTPEGVGFEKNDNGDDGEKSGNVKDGVEAPLLVGRVENNKAVGFVEAWKIPGVAPFALCLFFSKLVAYTFLYWLPFYITHTEIEGEYLSDTTAGTLSTLFDVGGILGGILAGHISDRLDARALTAASFMYLAIPSLFLYRAYGSISLTYNVILMFITGMLVNGPYALITTAVSADLGTHSSLNGNSRALATVTAIIDGTGSAGAAIGPLLTGYISSKSWNGVFTMLMVAAFVAGLLLTRLVIAELTAKVEASRIGRLSSDVDTDVVAEV